MQIKKYDFHYKKNTPQTNACDIPPGGATRTPKYTVFLESGRGVLFCAFRRWLRCNSAPCKTRWSEQDALYPAVYQNLPGQ